MNWKYTIGDNYMTMQCIHIYTDMLHYFFLLHVSDNVQGVIFVSYKKKAAGLKPAMILRLGPSLLRSIVLGLIWCLRCFIRCLVLYSVSVPLMFQLSGQPRLLLYLSNKTGS